MVPSPSATHRIVLTGFMGAGKTTVGGLLAAQLGWRFLDVDQELVHDASASIADLFRTEGEAAFRRREEETIARLLEHDHAVLALGGGALESQSTRELLLSAPATRLIFLETPLAVALARCAEDSGAPGAALRPVLLGSDQAALVERYHARLVHYRQAHHTLNTEAKTPAELAHSLLALIEHD